MSYPVTSIVRKDVKLFFFVVLRNTGLACNSLDVWNNRLRSAVDGIDMIVPMGVYMGVRFSTPGLSDIKAIESIDSFVQKFVAMVAALF